MTKVQSKCYQTTVLQKTWTPRLKQTNIAYIDSTEHSTPRKEPDIFRETKNVNNKKSQWIDLVNAKYVANAQ